MLGRTSRSRGRYLKIMFLRVEDVRESEIYVLCVHVAFLVWLLSLVDRRFRIVVLLLDWKI